MGGTEMNDNESITFVQIISSQWEDSDGTLKATTLGLTQSGLVYRYTGRGWKMFNMIVDNSRKE